MDEVQNLEHLTQFALNVTFGLEQGRAAPLDLIYALQYMKGACYSADAILRLHPESCYYAPWGRQVWNPTSLHVLARVLMEACANFCYFALPHDQTDLREFRFILANLHCVREREDAAERIEAAGGAPLVPEDWSGLSIEEQHRLLPWLKRRALTTAMAACREKLAQSRHFAGLEEDEKRRWLDGKGLYSKRDCTYRGAHCNAGFSGKSVHTRATEAGIPDTVYWRLQQQFSAHVHMTPHAADQIRAFLPVDSIARRSLVGLPTEMSAAILALAVNRLTNLFPDSRRDLAPELALWLDLYPQLLRRLDEEAGAESDEGQTAAGT